MAKKELTEEQIKKKIIKEFINDFNQHVKNLSSMVYIDIDGMIYFKSESSKFEKFASFIEPENEILDMFGGALYDTLDIFDYKKIYKVSKTNFIEDIGKLTLVQDNGDAEYKTDINYVASKDTEYCNRYNIISSMYSRLLEIIENEFSDIRNIGNIDCEWNEVSYDQMQSLLAGELVRLSYDSLRADVTKVIFPNIQKVDKIEYRALELRSALDHKCAYFLFKETYSYVNMNVYTLIATYQGL